LPPIDKEAKREDDRLTKPHRIKSSVGNKTETTLENVAMKKKNKKKLHGAFGTLTFPDGSVYEGQLKRGMPHG
jgi:hypothetical protein